MAAFMASKAISGGLFKIQRGDFRCAASHPKIDRFVQTMNPVHYAALRAMAVPPHAQAVF
jgi:hypothetical protein